jgi:MFS family permease
MQGLLKNRWWVVVGSFIGCGAHNGTVMASTFGLFLKPVAAEFGWSRAQAAAALAIAGVTSALSSPIWGKLIDRFGIEPVTLCAVTFFGCAMASIALTPPVLPVFLLLYAVAGVASAGASPLPYAKAIIGRFDRRRGLALGLAVAGVGVGGMLVPQAPQARLVRGAFGLTGLWFGDCRREKPPGLSERTIKNEKRNWIILAQT